MIVYLAIEITSIPLYMLAGMNTKDDISKEAVVKYFLLGAFASAITIYGISLVFTTTKTMLFSQLFSSLSGLPIEYMGLTFVFAGLFFKVAAFPFHFWAPDVYEGAPPVSTAFISVAPKIGVLIVMARFVGTALPPNLATSFGWVVIAISVLSMTFGNITAIWQTNVKRIFAYSSIAQIGYILMGVVVIAFNPGTELAAQGAAGILMYVTAYALMNIAGFSIIKVVEGRRGGSSLKHFAGLGKTNPALSIAMVVTLVSLLGVPWAAGFFGKLFVFKAAISAKLIWLVIVAVINSAISAFYYFGIVRAMYLEEPDEEIVQENFGNMFASVASGICALGTATLIMIPGLVMLIEKASQIFVG
ncbi:MAG: NADH-quinone oxidoreductase subunit N [Caldisericia bacterium]